MPIEHSIIAHTKLEDVEVKLLVQGIKERYDYDFSNYALASLKRRILLRLSQTNCRNLGELTHLLLRDSVMFDMFLSNMSITVTEMFRDPHFYVTLREKIIPILKTYPFVKIWHAGCSSGEEVYSMAILLYEADFLDKAMIYATDYNNRALATAKAGIYSLDKMPGYIKNYRAAGGTASLADYFHVKYDSNKLNNFLKKNIVFSHHNLVCDGVFGEMNLIICRNVLIYFNGDLQNRVVDLFANSLGDLGFLALGTKETIQFSTSKELFNTVSQHGRIYRKKI